MPLFLPVEDLSKLKVFSHLSPSGEPVLSLTLRATLPSDRPSIPPSSGIYVSFEREVEDGCWSLIMNTTMHANEGIDKSHLSEFSISPFGSSDSSLDSSNQFTPSTVPSTTELPLLEVGELQGNTSLEASSLPAWLRSQEEITSIDHADMDLTFGLNTSLTLSPGSTQPSQTPSDGGTSYDALFSDIFPSQLPQVTDLNFDHYQPPATSPSSPSHYHGGEESDASSSPCELQEHGNKHKRNLPCVEPACSRQFTNEHTRQKHMQTHRTKPRRSFPCTMGCSERFSRQHDRFRHEVAKHGYQSEWTCEECHGFFSSEKSRSSHKCVKGGRWKISVPKS